MRMLEVGLMAICGNDVLAGGNAAEDAAGVVGEEALRRQFVAVLAALLRQRSRNPRRSPRP